MVLNELPDVLMWREIGEYIAMLAELSKNTQMTRSHTSNIANSICWIGLKQKRNLHGA